MKDLAKRSQMEKLKGAALAYYGAKKAKAEAEKVQAEHRPGLIQLVKSLGEQATEVTKRVLVAGLKVDVRDQESPKPTSGAVAYVEEHLPDLKDELLDYHLDMAGVERMAADDKLSEEDLQNLVEIKSTTVVSVTEQKKSK